MTCCDELHTKYDSIANGDIQVGELPESLRVRGRVAWYVYRGSYRDLGTKGWEAFWRKTAAKKLAFAGAPGDVYICSPDCHASDRQERMLTLLWAPLK